jgi:hypothetical protein
MGKSSEPGQPKLGIGLPNAKPAAPYAMPPNATNLAVARLVIPCTWGGVNADLAIGSICNPGAKDHGTIDFGLFFGLSFRVQFDAGNG